MNKKFTLFLMCALCALVGTDARTRVAAGLYIVRADNVVKKVIVK